MSEKPETALVKQIVNYLRYLGAVAIRVNSGLTVIPETGANSRRVIRGAPAGTSDVLACYKGTFVAIECKVGDNKTTAAQELFLQQVREAGGVTCVAYVVEDVAKALGVAIYG